jgi:hypothetical protein
VPGFDGTGPMGLGPLTGRGMGYCAVRLTPSGSKAGPSLSMDPVSVGYGFSYPYRGMAYSQGSRLSRFGPGPSGGFRRRWSSQPRWSGFRR